jgi:GNAT superfamily N-acetyltransferase
MSDVTVRPARSEDLDVLVELVRGHVEEAYRRHAPSLDDVHNLLATLLYEKEGTVLVAARHDGSVAGFAILYFTFSTEHAGKIAVLNDIYLSDDLRGTGVASQLFEACRAVARENGFAYLTWQVTRDNEQAQRFFERMGAVREDWVSYSVS